MANSNPTVTVSAQSGSLIEDVSSTASIQLSSSSSTDKLSFIESALIKAGWVKTGVVNSYISAGLYGKATVDITSGKVTYVLDNTLQAQLSSSSLKPPLSTIFYLWSVDEVQFSFLYSNKRGV